MKNYSAFSGGRFQKSQPLMLGSIMDEDGICLKPSALLLAHCLTSFMTGCDGLIRSVEITCCASAV